MHRISNFVGDVGLHSSLLHTSINSTSLHILPSRFFLQGGNRDRNQRCSIKEGPLKKSRSKKQIWHESNRAQRGIEPRTSSTLKRNHTTRPLGHYSARKNWQFEDITMAFFPVHPSSSSESDLVNIPQNATYSSVANANRSGIAVLLLWYCMLVRNVTLE